MTRLMTIILSSAALTFGSVAAYSGDNQEDMHSQTKPMVQAKSFTEVDIDRSGTLDKSEAAAVEIKEEEFNEADKDTNGELDRKEYYAVVTGQQQDEQGLQ